MHQQNHSPAFGMGPLIVFKLGSQFVHGVMDYGEIFGSLINAVISVTYPSQRSITVIRAE